MVDEFGHVLLVLRPRVAGAGAGAVPAISSMLQVLAVDTSRPETWCVVGNCFARSKDHEAAIKYFRRALRADEDFTYAYTLCGLELFTNEEYEKAVSCFRQAMQKDPRHFNAWCVRLLLTATAAFLVFVLSFCVALCSVTTGQVASLS